MFAAYHRTRRSNLYPLQLQLYVNNCTCYMPQLAVIVSISRNLKRLNLGKLPDRICMITSPCFQSSISCSSNSLRLALDPTSRAKSTACQMRHFHGKRLRSAQVHAAPPARSPTESTPLVASSQQTAPAREDAIRWGETWRMVRPYVIPDTIRLKLLALSSVLAIVASKGCALLPPYAYKLAVDALAENILPSTTTLVVPYGAVVLYVLAKIGTSLFRAYKDYSYAVVSTTMTRRFSVDLFCHLQNLSLAFHLHRKTGEVMRIMERGSGSIDAVTSTIIFTLLPTFLEVAVVTGIFLKLGTPGIAIATFCTVVGYFIFTALVTNWRVKFNRDMIDADNAVSEKAVDTLINYETVKMFGMERDEISAYDRLSKSLQNTYIWFRFTLSSLNLGQAAIQNLGLGLCMVLAAMSCANGTLSPGDFVLINTYVLQLFQPLVFLGSSYRRLTKAATDVEKCIALFKTPIEVQDTPDAEDLEMKHEDIQAGKAGELRFENVSFIYKGNNPKDSGGLKNITFRVAPGKMVAFVGASGAGKSTIIRLLLRFYDVDSGAVLIDGRDIRSFTQRSLRREIGVVAQDTVLFNQSLRYNISYGKQDADDVEIYAAARAAALGDFVESLPEKLDTLVGERGLRLSGGERQRVGCARCIIKAPAFVLLDEASSALDTRTEREMQANLREVCKKRTTIVIAHRLSTIMMADEIIVLSKDTEDETLGRIIERGRHLELLKQNGAYAEMWEAQTAIETERLSEITESNGADS